MAKKIKNYEPHLDEDRLRDSLSIFLDKNPHISGAEWARQIGIHHTTLYGFIHTNSSVYRRTRVKIYNFFQKIKALRPTNVHINFQDIDDVKIEIEKTTLKDTDGTL